MDTTNKPASLFERKDLPKLAKKSLQTSIDCEYGNAKIVAYAADPLTGELLLTLRYIAETPLKGKLAERFIAQIEKIREMNPRRKPADVAPLHKAS